MTDSNKTTRRALLVLGMHRSGTSAVTRIVNLLGAGIGGSLVPAGQDNPSGFWEPAKVVKINDDLLQGLGRTWYDMRDMPSDWMKTAPGLEALKNAKTFIRRDMADGPLWVIKDPRLCLTAPVWIKALKASGFEVDCLFIVRDPREVVDSLHLRNEWPRSPLYLMWVQYLLEAEAATRECRRTMVTYDQVLGDWRANMERISGELHLTWPVAADEAAPAVDAFLDRNQRHHQMVGESLTATAGLPVLARLLYAACLEAVRGKQGWAAIASLRADFRKVAELYSEHVDALLTEKWGAVSRAETADSALAARDSVEKALDKAVRLSCERLQTSLSSLDGRIQQHQEALQTSFSSLDGRIQQHQEALQKVEARLQRQYELLNTVSLRLEQIAGDHLADKVDALTERVHAIRDAEVGDLRTALRESDAQLAGVLASTSWWLTRPLRWFSVRVLRRPPGRQ